MCYVAHLLPRRPMRLHAVQTQFSLRADAGAGRLCSGSADQKVKTWDVQRGACEATAKLDGAVTSLAALDGAVPLLGLTDAATLYTLDPRVRRGVVHSLKPGARLRRLSTVDSNTCSRKARKRYPSVAYAATKLSMSRSTLVLRMLQAMPHHAPVRLSLPRNWLGSVPEGLTLIERRAHRTQRTRHGNVCARAHGVHRRRGRRGAVGLALPE